MRLRTAALVTLTALALARVAAADECDPTTWFKPEGATVECFSGDDEKVLLSIDLADSYLKEAPSEEVGRQRLDALNGQRGKISFEIEYQAPDIAPVTLTVPANEIKVNKSRIGVALPLTDVPQHKLIRTIHVIFPPGSLFCEGALVEEDTDLGIPVVTEDSDAGEAAACLPGDEAARPLDWRIDAAPADDDAEDDPGLAVEFSFDREWGYNARINPAEHSWSTNLWRLDVEGSGTTNDADFHDSVTADFSWSWNRTWLDLGGGLKSPLTSAWLGGYVRPETTFEDDTRDYVFGARVEALLNLRKLIGTDLGTGTRPYLALGFEQVDPDKREDGTVPDNYRRASADLLWKFSPSRASGSRWTGRRSTSWTGTTSPRSLWTTGCRTSSTSRSRSTSAASGSSCPS